ncbi:integrase core domain-containing protein [Streptomyces olivaceus]|uniref:integrase core domain-containing protein n=1 Tax=Streptomyces olivaceus TaxID=47716 RepID=UPI001CC9E0AB|nr:integrase core domain-containing protein [Streptomyces olivaceus]
MESRTGLYKTELIKPRRPWHGLADVELATAEWVDWFNNQCLHTAIGHIPPHEHETNYYARHQPQPAVGVNAWGLHRSRSGSASCQRPTSSRSTSASWSRTARFFRLHRGRGDSHDSDDRLRAPQPLGGH